MPPHLLTFRPGMVLVLMRNIDQYMGLCNGTRLQLIGKVGENLKCTVLSGPMAKSGGYTLIPRVRFEYGRKSDETNIDRFVRIQYPVIPAFAMTINKAQGQTLQRVGLHLGTQVFSHGQVYTGFSRVTSREGLKIFNDRPKRPNFIINRVYEELLDAESAQTPPPMAPESQRIDRDRWPSVPGLGPTQPASWIRGVKILDGSEVSVRSEDTNVEDYASASDNDDAVFTEGRAPDIIAYDQRDAADDLDWTGVEFGFDEPAATEPPNRNAFNLLFPDGNQVDTAAWDMEPDVPCKITLIKADITTLPVDAVVNAANAQLRAGVGVCRAIFKAAGVAQLQQECDLYGGCQTGDAVLTGAYGVKQVRNIIHAVGPVVLARNVTEANRRDLGTCYTRSLDLAKAQGLRSIAFPCISTAIFGFPIDEATPIALTNVHYWLSQRDNADSMDQVVFCVFSDNDLRVYREVLPDYFDVYFDHELLGLVSTANARGYDDYRVSSSRMTVVVDSVSYSRSSHTTMANSRPWTAIPPAALTPVEELQRRSQPPKWPRELLDLDIDVLLRNVIQGRAEFDVDDEEREEAQRFLKQQEALQARKREREAANLRLRQLPTNAKDVITFMDVDEPTDQRAQVELRTKKTEAQRALQAAFRNSFHQTRLKDAFRASFINTVASTDAEDEGEPSLSVSRAPTPDERSKASADETEGTASSSSTSTSSSLSDEDKAVLGRISRMSLHEDEFVHCAAFESLRAKPNTNE
ncbi:MACRO domain-containing protein 1 [Aphelenchoides avenae]|nr:MACRO domain-containing protein 1 [Aphelenchus avenae]